MPNKMLIDATHPEETRVVVLRGNRVEEFDFESANRKQLRGNIYLAKVTRVEPSLQAAFVDYGGNRHGFLAFSEIHPDYYQIPVADRQALIDEEERAARAADAEADNRAGRRGRRDHGAHRSRDHVRSGPSESREPHESHESHEPHDGHEAGAAMAALSEQMAPEAGNAQDGEHPVTHEGAPTAHESHPTGFAEPEHASATAADHGTHESSAEPSGDAPQAEVRDNAASSDTAVPPADDAPPMQAAEHGEHSEHADSGEHDEHTAHADQGDGADTSENGDAGDNITEINGNGNGAGGEGEEEVIESVGGADAMEEVPERNYRSRRQYKIQEVIKRRQVMLVQVVKEERGTKGAALTTYLSLAGRYSVLMPNTARGGGISRKITSAEDRRRLKEIAQDLEVPEGMGVILRTAGAARTKTEVKRDFEYLLRLWETVRDLTLKSTAPTLVYEEGSLVKRSIRDLYNKDIDEVLVAGEEAFKDAKEFMRMLMPSHAKNVKAYRDTLPVFTRFGIESQLDAMFQPVVQLRSGGYIVLNQAEALVAIDVNSGRATREHHIEDTALKTNMEAAEEIARQLRLRDLAGLVVIDFIDMDEKRNNRTVERRLKESLKHDRARIQVGHISHFGLLEMSRQRIRSSVLESTTEKCPHCGGMGHVRSVSSVALQLLRALEEMLQKGATHNLIVRTRTEIALYLLNHKRAHLRALEERFQIAIMVNADATIGAQVSYMLEKGELVHSAEQARAIAAQPVTPAVSTDEDDDDVNIADEEIAEEDVEEAEAESAPVEPAQADGDHVERAEGDEAERNGRRRRRRRRGRRGEEGRGEEGRSEEGRSEEARESVAFAPEQPAEIAMAPSDGAPAEAAAAAERGDGQPNDDTQTESERRRRRGRRGGRRNRRGREGEAGRPNGFDADTQQGAQVQHGDSEPGFAPRDTDFATEHESTAESRPHAEASERPSPWQSSPPPSAAEPLPAAALWQPPEPAAPQVNLAPPAAEPAVSPRRRSTVREPAPMSFGETSTAPAPAIPEPPPAPTVVSAEPAEEEARPRRAGWWSRRVFGKG